jgi:hypothetical protein
MGFILSPTRDGYFEFENIKMADYLIKITRVGHKTTYSAPFSISAEKNRIDVGTDRSTNTGAKYHAAS